MDIPDYDKALFYSLWGHWDDLFILMAHTDDDILSKKIHHFLQAYKHASNQREVLEQHDDLLYYIDHAMRQIPTTTMEM